jgi:hypothetical protein
VVLCLLAVACREERPVRGIAAGRDFVPATKRDFTPVDSATRFGFRPRSESVTGSETGEISAEDGGYAYELPPGWVELGPAPMRVVNLRAGGTPGAECYVSEITGGGGLLADNVNRWRKQMGAPALSPQQVEALPRKPLLGGSAVLVEAEGTFTGMGDSAPQPNYRLLGLLLDAAGSSVSVKMVGPAAVVEAERANFERFCASLARAGARPAAAPTPPMSMGEEAAGLPLRWQVPQGWTVGAERAMRTVTLHPAGDPAAECAVYVFVRPSGGDAFGNFARWYGQMGQPFTAQDLSKLPELSVLGQPAKLAKIRGTYTAMDGSASEDAAMLAVFCELPQHVVCVKLTGPAALVDKEEEHFRAFVGSLSKEPQ